MFPRLTLVSLLLVCLAGCTPPWSSPNLPGTPQYAARVQEIEASLQEEIKKAPSVVVFRTSARVVMGEIHQGGNETRELYQGPVAWASYQAPLRRTWITLRAEWQYPGERDERHQHRIEYYERGTLVAQKESTGPGAFSVTLHL
jgi:hypothetical protein